MATATANDSPLAAAIAAASAHYVVPPDILAGIAQRESGGATPNPYANWLGYGGTFGTRVDSGGGAVGSSHHLAGPEPPLQQEANTAAAILRAQLIAHRGNIAEALSSYSGGGYTQVPNETTFGILPGYAGGNPGATVGAIPGGSGGGTGVGSFIGSVVSNPGSLASDFTSGASSVVSGATSWIDSALVRGGKIILGAGLLLVGLYLIARAFNAAPSAGQVVTVVTRGGSSGGGGGPGAASGAGPRRRGDAAAARGEPVVQAGQPRATTASEARSDRRADRQAARAAGRQRAAADAAFGDVPF